MIRIKFPRKPLNSQRKKAVELAKKLKYSENEYDSMAESENIKEFKDLLESIGNWQGVSVFVDDIEIEFNHLFNIYNCVVSKIPFTNFKWYNISKRRWDDQDFRDLPKKIEGLSDKNDFFMSSDLEDLNSMGLTEVIEYKKKYKVLKDEFKEKIKSIKSVVNKIFPSFDIIEVIKIVEGLPNEFEVFPRNSNFDEESEEDEDEKEPEGKEWVDWYDKIKYDLKVLKLLEKIEENTRK